MSSAVTGRPPSVGNWSHQAAALVEREDVGLGVGDLRHRGDVALHDALFLVGPADQVVHVEAHPVLGGAEDAAVRVEVVVRRCRGREAQDAAALDRRSRSGGRGALVRVAGIGGLLLLVVRLLRLRDRLLFLLLLLVGGGRSGALALAAARRGGLAGGLLRRVVIVVAAADQGEAGRAHAGAGGGGEEAPPAQPLAPHSLPVVALAHDVPPSAIPLGCPQVSTLQSGLHKMGGRAGGIACRHGGRSSGRSSGTGGGGAGRRRTRSARRARRGSGRRSSSTSSGATRATATTGSCSRRRRSQRQGSGSGARLR